MTHFKRLVPVCTILVAAAAAALGAEKAAVEKPAAEKAAAEKPAATKAGKAALVTVVKAVKGTVETRSAKGKPWTPVKAGMTLAEGADIRTGFRARCVLDMTDSLVQIDPLTVMRIGELRKEGKKVRTRLYMKHGNAQAVVEKGKIESDFAIVTPSATLSVRGTQGIKAGFFPVLGGSYGLAGPGLIAVRDRMLGRQTTCAPGESTDDTATNPVAKLAQLYLPIVLDTKAYDKNEVNAAGRWHTSTPMPGGLQGNSPPNTGVQTGSQEKDPDDKSKPSDQYDQYLDENYRGDPTEHPS